MDRQIDTVAVQVETEQNRQRVNRVAINAETIVDRSRIRKLAIMVEYDLYPIDGYGPEVQFLGLG